MSKKGNSSINELMGKKGEHAKANGLELHDLPHLLGEQMPKLDFHPLGRHRLLNALKQRFGPGFRNIPQVNDLLSKFDKEAQVALEHHKIKMRLGRK